MPAKAANGGKKQGAKKAATGAATKSATKTAKKMTIRPLDGFPVVRDLVIDRSEYFANVQALEPWIQRGSPYGGFP